MAKPEQTATIDCLGEALLQKVLGRLEPKDQGLHLPRLLRGSCVRHREICPTFPMGFECGLNVALCVPCLLPPQPSPAKVPLLPFRNRTSDFSASCTS